MTTKPLNEHGDVLIVTGRGHGADISSQRMDELDTLAVEFTKELAKHSPRRQIIAIDLASGRGAQAVRMAEAGADIAVAVDAVDFSAEFLATAKKARLSEHCVFVCGDMRIVDLALDLLPADIVVCQRAFHYLLWRDSLTMAKRLFDWLRPGGRAYISASGIRSELGTNYPHAGRAISERFSELSREMAEKHGIGTSVCLFDECDMSLLGTESGFYVERVFSSPFGNVKSVWIKPE